MYVIVLPGQGNHDMNQGHQVLQINTPSTWIMYDFDNWLDGVGGASFTPFIKIWKNA